MHEMDTPQRQAARARANRIRSYRAELKKDLAAGTVLLDDVLDADDPLLASMRVGELLMAVPGFGRQKVNGVLRASRISRDRPFGSLTIRERRDLYGRLCATPAGARAVLGEDPGRVVRSGRRRLAA